MPRRLDVVPSLLKEPCPVDPSTLPRVEGGLGCRACGHTVVDVAGLTLEELVVLRQRTRSGVERICSAYTFDSQERVLLRAAPNSSTVIAVAVSVLLAACDAGTAETAMGARVARPTPSRSVGVGSAAPAPVMPAPIATVAIPSAAPSAVQETHGKSASTTPGCIARDSANARRPGQGKRLHPADDPLMLAGY